MYRLKKDSWQPARLRRVDHVVLMGMLIGIAVVRGLDYTLGQDTWGAKDFMTAAAPAEVWGICGFLAGAVVLTVGVTTKRHLFVYIGHGWLGLAYGLNALALSLSTFPDFPFFDGIRGAGATAFVAAVHFLGLIRTGAHPLRTSSVNTKDRERIVFDEGDS